VDLTTQQLLLAELAGNEEEDDETVEKLWAK